MDKERKALIFDILIINILGSISFFLFEPLKDYLSNMDDYWFEFREYLGWIFLATGIAFFMLSLVLIILGMIWTKIVNILVRLEFYLILGLYIQSNFVPNTNGALDGTPIDWSNINVDMIVSDILWVMLILAVILVFRKVDIKKQRKVYVFTGIAILLIEVVTITSLIIMNSPVSGRNEDYFMSDCEEMNFSNEENVIVLVVDCFDSTYFKEALSDELMSELEGFTYYPDTTSMYGHTLCSLAQVLTGEPFINQSSYDDYEKDAFENSPLFDRLNKDKWNYGLYSDYEFPKVKSLKTSVNLIDSSYQISSIKSFYKIIYRIVGYSVAPYHLKEMFWFYPQLSDIKDSPLDGKYNVYTTNNEMFYEKLGTISSTKDEPVFRFFHIEGMHTPYMTDENVKTCEDEVSFEQNREACYRIIQRFIEQLKSQNLYDNSALIIMADHGGLDRVAGLKQNPLFMIKGFEEKHDFQTSDRKITFENIMTIYNNLMDKKCGSEIAGNENDAPRIFYEYGYDTMDQMKEYYIKGKAWEVPFE